MLDQYSVSNAKLILCTKKTNKGKCRKTGFDYYFYSFVYEKFASSSPCGRCCCYDKSQGSFLLCYFSLLVVPIIPRLEILDMFFIFKIGAE